MFEEIGAEVEMPSAMAGAQLEECLLSGYNCLTAAAGARGSSARQ